MKKNNIYAVDYESPHQDGDADMFNFRNTLVMVQRQGVFVRVDRLTVRLVHTHTTADGLIKATSNCWRISRGYISNDDGGSF